MTATFRPYQTKDHAILSQYIFNLYLEDAEGQEMTQRKIDLTIKTLTTRPVLGRFILFDYLTETVGYALLINYWSNEYGGVITHLDELYVHPKVRGKGIATSFVRHLQKQQDQQVAIELQVMPGNERALKLYQTLGFEVDKNRHLIWSKT